MVKKILTSIWFLAIFVAIPVVVFFPTVFSKYNCELVSQKRLDNLKDSRVYFEDLDSDTKIEKIIFFRQPVDGNTLSFQFFDENGGMIDQVNFAIEFHIDIHNLYFEDADGDGNKEIYLFSFERDSLVLNWLQVTPKESPLTSVGICELNYYEDGLLDYSIGPIYCVDLENDGKKELVFTVNGGYSYSPRQIFKVNTRNQTVTHSENTGSVCGPLTFSDLDDDGIKEIISDGQVGPARDWFNLPYNRPAPYLKVYNSDLSFFFPPIKFCEGIQSITQTFTNGNNGKELICSFLSWSSDCEPFRVYKINVKGEKIDSLLYETKDRTRVKYVFQNARGNFVTQINPSEFLEYTPDLKILKKYKLKDQKNLSFISVADINNDGNQEYFLANTDSPELLVFSDNFNWSYSILTNDDLVTLEGDLFRKPNQFYIKTNSGYFIYSFTKNPYYIFKYFFFLLVYLLSVFIVFLFQKILESRLKERYELRNQVRELQMKSLKNQLDPHFMYNTFNTIASVIKQGRKDEAYDLFILLSKMVRSNLDSSTEIYTTIKSEIDFVNDYLNIQKFRFKDMFEYKIHIDKEVDSEIEIPKMLFQIHVENALKHGIRNLKTTGFLQIRILKVQQDVRIEIEDNGIGRDKSKIINKGKTGIGLKTIKQIIELNNQKGRNRISQKIVDLKNNEGLVAGTLVILNIIEKS